MNSSQPQSSTETSVEAVSDQAVRRRAWEGKSIQPDIDLLIIPVPAAEKNVETEWTEDSGGDQKKAFDFLIWMAVVAIAIAAAILGMSYQPLEKASVAIEPVEEIVEDEEAINTHASLLQTVQSYLQSETVEKKLVHVRNSSQTKERMEKYYRTHPLTPEKCLSLVRFESFFYQDRQFWHVTAQINRDTGLVLLLEELSDNRFLVDWESHVDYQPMPWDDFVSEKPIIPMSFRVMTQEYNYYGHEFSDEKQWACYMLSQSNSEEILYGYVARNSEQHVMLQKALAHGPKRMILELQASKGMSAKKSVVIQKVVSDSIYRITAPSTLYD